MNRVKISNDELRDLLETKYNEFNRPEFIVDDPISIPHQFSQREDIEISGFFAAVLAWGQRVTIIRKCRELMAMMDNTPHQFILHHREKDLKPFLQFKHRTFNATDTLYFIHFLQWFYRNHSSLSEAFAVDGADENIESGLIRFQNVFFGLKSAPDRTRKHIPTPERKSTCKRLVMYLRWMVRDDRRGVDFGLWKEVKPSQLICPCDLHVDRLARMLKLIKRKQTDWQTALELTSKLKQFDAMDPVKYDFALFGMGVNSKVKN